MILLVVMVLTETIQTKGVLHILASQILGRIPRRKRKKTRVESSSEHKKDNAEESSAESDSKDQKDKEVEREDPDPGKEYETCCAKNYCQKRASQMNSIKGKIIPQDKTLNPKQCSRCKGNAHFDCTRVKFNKYFCLPCLMTVKQKQSQNPSKNLKKPPVRHVVPLPPDLADVFPTNDDEHGDCPRITNDSFHLIIYDKMDNMGYDTHEDMQEKEWAHNRWLDENRPRLPKMTVKERKEYTAKLKSWEQYRRDWLRGLRVACKEALTDVETAVTGLRYDKKRKKWFVQVEWTQDDGVDDAEQEINLETIEVEYSWVMDVFKPEIYHFVRDFESLSEYGFHPVPKNNTVTFGIDKRMVSKVKYCPETDMRPAKYFVKFTDNLSKDSEEEMSEETLLTLFNPEFLRMVCHRGYNRRRFVHIPPGNARSAKVDKGKELHQNYKKAHLLPIKFQQYNRSTCVCSSFALALWAVGFQELAIEINNLAIETEQDPNVLGKVVSWVSENRSRSHCLQPQKIKQSPSRAFSLMEADLTNSLALVVLSASDGSRSHAITIHDGYIFDGNESTAIPLSVEALNYLCSTRLRKASYTGVVAGYLFVEQGKRKK